MTGPVRIVVMGVAASGKSTVARELAARLGCRFVEGDDLHPATNVAKMAAGEALSDDDRWPWLAGVRQELRQLSVDGSGVVVSCSALRRSYRDLLRHAGAVCFVHLDIDAESATRRAAERPGHFMSTAMVASQFAALEPPAPDEVDVVTVDAAAPLDGVVDAALRSLGSLAPRPDHPLLAHGNAQAEIDDARLAELCSALVQHVLAMEVRRVLLVPPDQTRLHSRAGRITARLLVELESLGCEVGVLPAIGTHAPMQQADAELMFGDAVSADRLLEHRWQHDLRLLGEIAAEEVAAVSRGRYDQPIPVAVNAELFNGWDLVVSIGQVVPHEVIGMANFTKNLVIGLGGAPTIHGSHFLGAMADMETIMGRSSSPVRDVVDAAFDRFLAPQLDVLWVLTVVEATDDGPVHRGLFAGTGGSMSTGGAAYRSAAALAAEVNIETISRRYERVVCWLDPDEFRSTWVGNKAIYRTRMAVADGGEVIVLAPGVGRFGEDDHIDELIRRHGYRGTEAMLGAMAADPDLAASLGAAAHLVHGSSEGRFRITYCTDPAAGGLSRDAVESVGFSWRSLPEELASLGVGGSTPTGAYEDVDRRSFHFIADPALGLWRAD